MTDLIAANCALLQQATALLVRMDTTAYNTTSPVFLHSSIGGHLRHLLEHYQSLLRGWRSGRVDYEARARDLLMETQPEAARERLGEILLQLQDLALDPSTQGRENFMVKSAHGAGEPEWHPSSAGRELQFLVSHTVHHFALIAGLCHLQGIDPEPGFGVAPSTLRHRALIHA